VHCGCYGEVKEVSSGPLKSHGDDINYVCLVCDLVEDFWY